MSSQALLNRGFKKPSQLAVKQGKARLMMEEMVHEMEQKLQQTTSSSSNEQHMPGTLLSNEEMMKIYEESGCENSRKLARHCFSVPTIHQFRSIDGTCNNFKRPLQGASDTAFRRLINSHYEDGISSLRGFKQAQNSHSYFQKPYPSARMISSFVVKDGEQLETPYSHLLMQFGQFLDHDMDLAPELEVNCSSCNFTDQCSPIRVQDNDSKFGKHTPQKGDCLTFRRSVAVCSTDTPESLSPREQMNVLTSYIDGSMVYGSNQEQAFALRAFKDGLLKVGPVIGDGSSLPVDDNDPPIVDCLGREPKDCFLCGDVRCNEHVSLTVIHTLWVREHNRIARDLRKWNHFWSDERLYQEARKIVGAMIQKIVYYDYLPKILGKKVFDVVIGEYNYYSKYVDASIPNAFATAAFRFGHSLVRPKFQRLKPDYSAALPPLELVDMFFNPSQYAASYGVGPLARGWVGADSRHLDEHLNDVLTSRLFETSSGPGMDLASLNIQRHRDHGMPTYGAWKEFCSKKFPQLQSTTFENHTSETLLQNLHGEKEKTELWVAGLAEKRLPGSLLGTTFACIFGATFKNLRNGDRFYFERKGVFTKHQLNQIMSTSLSRIICDNTDTSFIQPDPFLTNQTRVHCNSLPKPSLSAWRENTCFVRVDATPGRPITAISKLGHYGRTATYTNSDNKLHRCVPVLCPIHYDFLTLTMFPSNHSQCSYTTLNIFQSYSGNARTFHRKYIHKYNRNVFGSLHNCQECNVPSITFSCYGNNNGGTVSSSPLNNPESSEYSDGVPSDVASYLEHTKYSRFKHKSY